VKGSIFLEGVGAWGFEGVEEFEEFRIWNLEFKFCLPAAGLAAPGQWT